MQVRLLRGIRAVFDHNPRKQKELGFAFTNIRITYIETRSTILNTLQNHLVQQRKEHMFRVSHYIYHFLVKQRQYKGITVAREARHALYVDTIYFRRRRDGRA